jgi:Family of unknown function (DUF5678)
MQVNNEKPTTSPVSLLGTQSFEAFYRNLPELLEKYYGKWVAYHGAELVGTGRSQTALYQKCLHRGYKEDEFVVLLATSQALYDRDEILLPPNR